MFCENCGSPLPEDSKFCLNCGAKTESVEAGSQAIQEAAAVTEEVIAEAIPDTETVLQTEQQTAPTEPIQYEPQPKPVPPVVQPEPAKPTPMPEPTRYAPQQPVAPAQQYKQPTAPPAAPTQPYQQTAPIQPEMAKKEKPLPTWKFIGIFLLTSIPIVNIIMILVWSFGHSCNKNTKSFARAVLILFIISLLLTIAAVIINLEAIRSFVDYFNATYEIGFFS